jgi:hypothetical protein
MGQGLLVEPACEVLVFGVGVGVSLNVGVGVVVAVGTVVAMWDGVAVEVADG